MDQLTAPIRAALLVTPSDTVDLTRQSRALYIGVAGDVDVTLDSGDHVLFKDVAVGFLAVRVKRVWATLTTATNILACQ